MELKNYAMPIAALLAVIIAGYGIYIVGMDLLAGGDHEETGGAERIFLAALEKRANYSIYTYEENVSAEGDYPFTSRMVEGAGFALVKSKNALFEKSAYFNSTADVFCVSFGGKTDCSFVSANSTLRLATEPMRSLLFSKSAKKDFEMKKLYVNKSIIKFLGEPQNATMRGKECQDVKFTLDYSKLTLQDLNDIGMSPGDPMLLYFRNHTLEYCIDNESNILRVKWTYYYLGEKRASETTLAEAKWGSASPSEFGFPALANESETENLYLDALSARKSLLACAQNQSTKDGCIRTYAVQNSAPDICLLAGTLKDKCILTLAPGMLRTDLCGKVDNSSLRDDCWTEMAARKNDSSLCANVADAAKKGYCLSLISQNASKDECGNDSGCFTAGCSGQLCVPESGKGIITTCEYRPEYACLNLTRCGCSAGKCAWEQNANYSQCLADVGKNATADKTA